MSDLSNDTSINVAEDLWDFLMLPRIQFSQKQFSYLAFWSNPHKHKVGTEEKYKNYYIPKKTWWYRIIREPCDILKTLQKEILQKILKPYTIDLFKPNCTGFREWFSTVDNANYHLNKKMLIKLDIANFFPSISQARIYGLFRKKFMFNHEISSYLSGLCSYKNELPQWAPTSPIIANIISSRIDDRIILLIQALNCKNSLLNLSYSRYADDLTFSYDDLTLNKITLIYFIQSIVEDEWFSMNLWKINIIPSSQKQKVTWIVVNGIIPSIGRKTYRYFRVITHSIRSLGWDVALTKWNQSNSKQIENVDKFKEVIKGYLNYFLMVNRNSIYLHQMKNLFTDQI